MEAHNRITPDAYLVLEARSETKHEYWNGRVVSMAGASVAHNRIAANIVTALNNRLLDRDCNAVAADLRVQVESRYFYPDIVVECGEPELTATEPPSLLNPVLLMEVTSSSTGDRDRGIKLHAYIEIPSLQEYWIVDSERAAITQYVRQESGWIMAAVLGGQATARSPHFGWDIPMHEIYRRVLP